MTWTLFWDMHSGGGTKTKWEKIYIQAPQKEAEVIFYNMFRQNPYDIACPCCGENFSVREDEELCQLSGFHRNCDYDRNTNTYAERPGSSYRDFETLESYIQDPAVRVIFSDEISESDRIGELPHPYVPDYDDDE